MLGNIPQTSFFILALKIVEKNVFNASLKFQNIKLQNFLKCAVYRKREMYLNLIRWESYFIWKRRKQNCQGIWWHFYLSIFILALKIVEKVLNASLKFQNINFQNFLKCAVYRKREMYLKLIRCESDFIWKRRKQNYQGIWCGF